MKKHYRIRITGIVQGVGFRPFIFNLAIKLGITGYVFNNTEGVIIEAEGLPHDLDVFISQVSIKAPPLSRIHELTYEETSLLGFTSFSIEESKITKQREAFYSPDIAVCEACLKEFFNKKDRRYRYPFITCIHCGPRFSIIRNIPYDRINTSMDKFLLCESCRHEYENPRDRRFHAQPVACGKCGPRYYLYTNKGVLVTAEQDEIPSTIIDQLKKGSIIAIKGIGGYHLALDASNEEAIMELRRRKKRPSKPLALMAGSIDTIKNYAEVSPYENDLLISKERPILLLKSKGPLLSSTIAPGLTYLGFMLPYTPLQHHIFAFDSSMVLVMTSGNLSEEPIIFEDKEVFERLKNIADFIVSYDREIIGQSDDSVLFVVRDRPFMIRRSRGYVPRPFISRKTPKTIIALGGDLKNSFGIAKNNYVILSQYLGDMADLITFKVFQQSVNHFMRIFDAVPDVVVSDLHPGYITTQYAEELAGKRIFPLKVQHHHAHIASVMEERDIDGDILGIAFDGTGFGIDGNLWGSEIIIANRSDFSRAGHFSYFPLPGGENAIRDVWKIGISLLMQSGSGLEGYWEERNPGEIVELIEKGVRAPLTCSIGRLFDGISAILGISEIVSAEAEAAILLEEAASMGKIYAEPYIIPYEEINGILVLSTEDLVRHIVDLKKRGQSIADIALAFHLSLAKSTLVVLEILRKRTGLNRVALSGGVFHNRILLEMFIDMLKETGFELHLPQNVPFNDQCIALGQIAVAREWIEKGLHPRLG